MQKSENGKIPGPFLLSRKTETFPSINLSLITLT